MVSHNTTTGEKFKLKTTTEEMIIRLKAGRGQKTECEQIQTILKNRISLSIDQMMSMLTKVKEAIRILPTIKDKKINTVINNSIEVSIDPVRIRVMRDLRSLRDIQFQKNKDTMIKEELKEKSQSDLGALLKLSMLQDQITMITIDARMNKIKDTDQRGKACLEIIKIRENLHINRSTMAPNIDPSVRILI